MFDEARDAQDKKTADRVEAETANSLPVLQDVAVYDGFASDQPKGRSHRAIMNGGNIYGEFITPFAVSQGDKVAVYPGTSGYLFDAL